MRRHSTVASQRDAARERWSESKLTQSAFARRQVLAPHDGDGADWLVADRG